jgi:predicted HTH transcriptional regulator
MQPAELRRLVSDSLSAFANRRGGGVILFGLDDNVVELLGNNLGKRVLLFG